MPEPTDQDHERAREIVADMKLCNCTALADQEAFAHYSACPAYKWKSFRDQIATAFAAQRERAAHVVEGARYEPGSNTHIEYVEGFKTGIRYAARTIREGH